MQDKELQEFQGKLSESATIGAAYRVTRGKGSIRAASAHSLAVLGDELPAFASESSKGPGHGHGACLVSLACLDCLPISVALASRFQAAGPLLREAQGQHDLAIAKGQAARLLGTMRRSGATPSNATEGDAIGDGALSIVAWRNLYGPRLLSESAGLVCWRACVASVARLDMLGESIEAWRRDDGGGDGWDLLTGSALPLPQLCGDSSREDKASRLRWQRARGQRFAKLGRRVASIKLRATGRRVAVVDKVQRAAVQLLHGASLDEAALAAGFKASGQGRQAVRAGDRLTQAVRRLGFRVQFNARDHEHQQEHARGACVPLSLATVAAWHVQPSATLPLQSGRGDKQWVPLLRRLQRKRARVAKLQAAWVARAARVERASAKLASLERWQARQGAKSGLWAGLITSGNLPQYGHGKRRRM